MYLVVATVKVQSNLFVLFCFVSCCNVLFSDVHGMAKCDEKEKFGVEEDAYNQKIIDTAGSRFLNAASWFGALLSSAVVCMLLYIKEG